MRTEFEPAAWAQYEWFERHKPKLAAKIRQLIANTEKTPFTGLGQPEPLKYEFAGCWSRRISKEHRLVYYVDGKRLVILQCRYHY
ncbi:MAG: Txe/YoeB family addiction module toxin [Alphaproteobacteria bacterium]